MESLVFEDLPSHHCAMVDLGSILNFSKPEVIDFLKGTDDKYRGMRDHAKRLQHRGMQLPEIQDIITKYYVLKNQSLMAALILLERMICYDLLIVDEVALELANLKGRTVELFPSDIVRSSKVANKVYEEASRQISANLHLVNALTSSLPNYAFHQGDKDVHDQLLMHPVLGRYSFADSTDPLQRVFFYLEVARATNLPLILSAEKSGLLLATEAEAGREIHRHISSMFDDSLKSDFDSSVAALSSIKFSLPPLSMFLIRKMLISDIPLLYAAQELRSDSHAKAYREYLRKLHLKLQGGRPGLAELSDELRDIKNVADDWSKSHNVSLHVKYEKREIARIPGISLLSAILKVADKAGLKDLLDAFRNFKPIDPILYNRRPYLAFIADWYRA